MPVTFQQMINHPAYVNANFEVQSKTRQDWVNKVLIKSPQFLQLDPETKKSTIAAAIFAPPSFLNKELGAQAVGLAQGALEAAVDYARQRIQFEHPIISLPVVQNMLADMAIEVEAARALTYAVARTVDSGAKHFTEEAAMAKVFASDIAMKVTTDAVQILGGAGYMKDYPVEKMMRDAKITQIYEGTNQVLRNTIAFALRKGKAMKE